MMLSSAGISTLFAAALVFCRIGAALRWVPFFGGDPLPGLAWLGLSGALTLVLFPLVPAAELTNNGIRLAALIAKELFIGTLIGVLVRLAFSVLESAGRLARRAMYAVPFVPETDATIRLYFFVGAAALLLMNGHHALISGLAASFRCTPPQIFPDAALGGPNAAIALFSHAMSAAVLIAAPLFAAGLAADWVSASLSRLVSDAASSAAETVRTLSVQAAVILTFIGAVRLSLGVIEETLQQLRNCAPV